MTFANYIKSILHPPVPPDYIAFYKDLLNTTGVLFGLAFAGLLFIIQSGLASSDSSRRIFLEIYVHFGSGLLLSLAYLTVLPFAMLHFPFYSGFYTFLYYLFSILYAKAVLDHSRQHGYVHTLTSTAFVPASFGGLRRYFRYISNLGYAEVIGLSLVLLVLLGYPVVVSVADGGSWTITQKGFFYSSILVLCHVALRLINFIPAFFKLSNQEVDFAQEPSISPLDDALSIDISAEKVALQQFLQDHGVRELDPKTSSSFLDGEIRLELRQDPTEPEAWFNANVTIANPTNVEIRDQVCQYAIRIFDLFAQSPVGINQMVISFHIRIVGDTKLRNMFFRTTRSELQTALAPTTDAIKKATSLENVLFDELFRNL